MEKEVKPHHNDRSSKKDQVTEMFNNISNEYDGMNRLISLGLDKKWRDKVVQIIKEYEPDTVIDIATGTGDLVISIAKETNASKLIGLDISPGMLEVGKIKVDKSGLNNRIEMVVGDSENLSYEDNSIDVATVSYGVRNFENLEKGLSEILRVLKPTGMLVILETSVPTRFPFKQGYYLFSGLIVPTLGKLFSKDKAAYGYLSKSAATFPHGERFNTILKRVGFKKTEALPQFYGASTIYKAFKS